MSEEILSVTQCKKCNKNFAFRGNLPKETLVVCPWCNAEYTFNKIKNVKKRIICDERKGT